VFYSVIVYFTRYFNISSRMRMEIYVARNGDMVNKCKSSDRNPEGKRLLGNPRRIWENFRTALTEAGCEDVS